MLLVFAVAGAACSGSSDPEATPPTPDDSSAPASTTPAPTTAPTPSTTLAVEVGADLILHNAQVVTVDREFTVTDAIAVTDGVITEVGSDADVLALAGPDTHVVDLGGQTVLPGFVEPHTHEMQAWAPDIAAMRTGHQLLLEWGVTTAGMPTVLPGQLAAFEEMDAAGEIRIRSHLYLSYNSFCGDRGPGDFYRETTYERDVSLRLAVAGVKIFTDGGVCGGPALSVPYLDTVPEALYNDGWRDNGDLFVTSDEIAAVLREVDAAGGQTVIHAIGDIAVETALVGIDRAGDLDLPHQIHHNSFAALVDPEILEIYGRRDVIPVVQLMPWARACEPGRTELWQSIIAPDTLARVEDLEPIRAANPGIRVAWHGDSPSVVGSPLQHMFSAVTTGSAQAGEICYPEAWEDRATVGVEAALRMTTIDAAAAMGYEDSFGSIEVGKVADLTIIEHDIFDPDLEAAFALNRAVATIISGTTEYCRAELCALLGAGEGGGAEPVTDPQPPAEPERPPAGGCAAPPPGLVGWWAGDETTADLAGTSEATLEVGAGYLDGVVGAAFSPSGSAIAIAGFPPLGESFSIETWVSLEGVDADEYLTVFNNDRFFLRKDNRAEGNAFAAFVKLDDGSVEPRAQSTTAPTPNVWYHLAATWDGTTLALYVDGTVEAEAERNGALVASTVPAQIGRGEQDNLDGPVFYGRIDEFSVYDRALDAGEVAAIHAAGSAGKCR